MDTDRPQRGKVDPPENLREVPDEFHSPLNAPPRPADSGTPRHGSSWDPGVLGDSDDTASPLNPGGDGDTKGILRGPGILKIASIVLFLASLYVATWVGGTQSHARELRAQAERVYKAAVWQENHAVQKDARLPGTNQGPAVHHLTGLRKGGPRTWVDWSVPLLPGLLLVDSGQIVGPRWGEKGVKLVLYYGFGSTVVLRCDARNS